MPATANVSEDRAAPIVISPEEFRYAEPRALAAVIAGCVVRILLLIMFCKKSWSERTYGGAVMTDQRLDSVDRVLHGGIGSPRDQSGQALVRRSCAAACLSVRMER